jgi:uncharacterized protein (DUF3820 family)
MGHDDEPSVPRDHVLVALARARMPFGKYAGRLLMDLPTAYLAWFERKGYPPGKIGEQLRDMYAIREAGASTLLQPLRESEGKPDQSG